MVRIGQFDERCPCKQDCAGRSAECRKTCAAYAEYANIKTAEYEKRVEEGEKRRLARAWTQAQSRFAAKARGDTRRGKRHLK